MSGRIFSTIEMMWLSGLVQGLDAIGAHSESFAVNRGPL